MCDFKSKWATIPCPAEKADRLTKHLLPMHIVEAADSSTPLRSAQNDSALMTTDLEVTHEVILYRKPFVTTSQKGGFVMNHLNYFEPYKSKGPHHEDQLTRAFLVVLRMVPLVQTTFIDLIRSYQILNEHDRVLPTLTEPQMKLDNIQTQVKNITDSQGYLVSLLMTNKNWTPETKIENVDRSARYDGVIYFDSDPKWILVIENKPWSENVWEEQLNPSIAEDSEIEIVEDPVGIDWKEVIEHLSALLQKQLVHGAEALLIEDFLTFVDTHFGYLNPFSKFSICKDDPYLINRRCVRILESISIGEVQGQHIELGSNDLPARRIYLGIKREQDNNWCIELKIHPGDTMAQARALYESLNTDALQDLTNRGWNIDPNLHFSHIQKHLYWTNTPLDLEAYINFWEQNPQMISQVNRDSSDFCDFFLQLLQDELISCEDVSGLEENFTKTGRSYLRTCPGLSCIYRWNREEALRLDDSEDTFIDEVRQKITRLLETWD